MLQDIIAAIKGQIVSGLQSEGVIPALLTTNSVKCGPGTVPTSSCEVWITADEPRELCPYIGMNTLSTTINIAVLVGAVSSAQAEERMHTLIEGILGALDNDGTFGGNVIKREPAHVTRDFTYDENGNPLYDIAEVSFDILFKR